MSQWVGGQKGEGGLGRQTLRIWVRDVGALHVVTPKGVSATRKHAARSVVRSWAGPSVAVCEMIIRGRCITHSAALRKRSCTRDPPGKLGRPGFSTDIPLEGRGSDTIEVKEIMEADLRSPPANQLSPWPLPGSSSSSSSLTWGLAGGSGWVVSPRVAILGPLEPCLGPLLR